MHARLWSIFKEWSQNFKLEVKNAWLIEFGCQMAVEMDLSNALKRFCHVVISLSLFLNPDEQKIPIF